MASLKQRYVVDANGERVGVILEMDEYRRILEQLEELECVRAYDAAKASQDEAISLEQAAQEIEQGRR